MSTTEMKAVPAGGSRWRAIVGRGTGAVDDAPASPRGVPRKRSRAIRCFKEFRRRTPLARPGTRDFTGATKHVKRDADFQPTEEVVMSSTQARTNAEDPSEHSPHLGVEDPDRNPSLLQEVTTRLPGRVNSSETSLSTASDLAGALHRTAAAHCEREIRAGQADAKCAERYAEYRTREQTRTEFPT
jgi:hypothetical protein